MTAYKPPLEGRMLKEYLLLDFNEMTIKPSPKVREALTKYINAGSLQTYPGYGDLDLKVAHYSGVNSSEVMVTNGSDQAIDIIMRAFLGNKDRVIIPTPTFAMFYQSAHIQGAEILEPLYRKNDLSFPFEETLSLIDKSVKLLVICNPNNPTGTSVSRQKMLQLLEKAQTNDVAVLHDEAYFEFSGITLVDILNDFENLFITRTFSKQFGLASIRAGYLLSQEQNIEQLLKIRGPYDVNMFAKTAIIAALNDVEYAKKYLSEIMEKSKPKLEEYLRKNRIAFYPSDANFILINPDDSQKFFDYFKKEGILIRPREGPHIEGTIRISIGTLQDTDRFIKVYSQFLKNDN